MYDVKLAYGRVKEYGANIIAENMLTQVDSDGFSLSLMEGIIDYKCDDLVAIPKIDKYITTARGKGDCGKPQQVGNCWSNGGIKASHGLNYLNSKNLTLWKLQSLQNLEE